LVATYHWPIQPVEDNAFALLATATGRIASLHTSWTQWRNLFRFEVLCTGGYARIEGLGGSYGVERLTVGRRQPESGPPIEEEWMFDGPDESWAAEWVEFRAAIDEHREPLGSGRDGLAAALVIRAIYDSAAQSRTVSVARR
jgi:predicted dehydrogenase